MSLTLNQIVTGEELEEAGISSTGQNYADLEIIKNDVHFCDPKKT